MSVPSVVGVFILDDQGKRIAAKYYTKAYKNDYNKQVALEKHMYSKSTHKPNVRILNMETILYEDIQCVYTCIAEITSAAVYVIMDGNDNELIGFEVLLCITEAVEKLLPDVNKLTLYSNVDYLYIAIDECIDDGMIIEIDSARLAERVKDKDGAGMGSRMDIPLSEQNFTQALQTAKEQLIRSFK